MCETRGKERAVRLVIDAPIAPRDVPALCRRARACVAAHGHVVCDVSGLDDPDLATVDTLARLQLTVRRLGGTIRLRGATQHLEELLALTGLGDVLPLCPELCVEPGGEPEQREEALGVEEEADARDLAAGDRQDL